MTDKFDKLLNEIKGMPKIKLFKRNQWTKNERKILDDYLTRFHTHKIIKDEESTLNVKLEDSNKHRIFVEIQKVLEEDKVKYVFNQITYGPIVHETKPVDADDNVKGLKNLLKKFGQVLKKEPQWDGKKNR